MVSSPGILLLNSVVYWSFHLAVELSDDNEHIIEMYQIKPNNNYCVLVTVPVIVVSGIINYYYDFHDSSLKIVSTITYFTNILQLRLPIKL